VPFFLDATSVTPGKHMEAIREGIQDYEYLVMLRDRLAAAEKQGRGGALLEKARPLLNQAAARVCSTPDVNPTALDRFPRPQHGGPGQVGVARHFGGIGRGQIQVRGHEYNPEYNGRKKDSDAITDLGGAASSLGGD
jgi:hypothetical protein